MAEAGRYESREPGYAGTDAQGADESTSARRAPPRKDHGEQPIASAIGWQPMPPPHATTGSARPEQSEADGLLVVPLRIRDRVIGTLEISRDEPGRPYTLEDQIFLQELADRAAAAIDNTCLYGQLTERERRLQDLIGRLFMAQKEERRRVAYEVHDELAQVAASTHQHLQAFAPLPPAPLAGGQEPA